MPYIAPTQYQDRRALIANTDAQEQATETSQLRNMLLQQQDQRANQLRQVYQQNKKPTVEQIGAVDPNAALEYENNSSLQAQRDLDNRLKTQHAVKGLATQMIMTAERYGFKRDDPSTYGVLEQLAPKFRPLFEGITGTKGEDGPVSAEHIVMMADLTPGEIAQQKTQDAVGQLQQTIPLEVEKARQEAQVRAEAELGKQRQLQPMEMELERYKSGLKTQQQLDETTGKASATAKINLPKVIDQTNQALRLLDNLKNHPGLSASVGVPGVTGGLLGGKIIPGTEAANFNAKLKQIQGQTFLQAFEALKGGGQITEIEGQKATEAIANLDTAQTEEAFKNSVNELESILKTALRRTESAAIGEYKPGSSSNIGGQKVPEGWTDEDEAEYQAIVGGK